VKFKRSLIGLFIYVIFLNLLWGSSEIKSFPDVQDDPPGSLTIISPVNNASCVQLKPEFSWNTPSGSLPIMYSISLYRGNTLIDSIVTSDTNYTLSSDLLPNTTYNWYLSAKNNLGTSVTISRTFVTGDIPSSPVQLQPAAGILVPVNVTLGWSASTGCPPVKYTLQVWDLNSSSFIINNPNVSGNSYQVNLASGRNYQWRIRSSNTFGQSAFTVWRTFSTGVNLSAPVLATPGSGSVSSVPQIPLKWFSSYQADSYVIQISSNPQFTYPLIIYTTVSDTFYNFNLWTPQTYYWRVQAKNSLLGTSSPFSEIYNFSVNSISLTTSIVSPSGACITALPTLRWRKASDDPSVLYNLEVSSSGTVYLNQPAMFDTSFTFTSPLPLSSEIYWHVTPYLSTGTGQGANSSFKTIGPPPAVQITLPHCGEAIPNQYIAFGWTYIEDCPPFSYRVQLNNDGGVNIDTLINTNAFIAPYLSPDRAYTLKVTPYNSFGPGPVSSCAYTTYWGMDVQDETQIMEYLLSQNYPNPFNPVTKISYQTVRSGLVTLKIYDILGNEMEQIVNCFQEPGRYEVTFNGSSLVSGVYFYKLTINEYSSVKKLLLMK